MARYVAKNVVAAGLAGRCTLQLAYAIGVADPVSVYVYVDLHGTGRVDERRLCSSIRATFDLTPAGIIKVLDLRRPIYRSTAVLGHFGREDQGFTWERTDRTAELISHCQ
jgi:S-adenosylmethionine synthetase